MKVMERNKVKFWYMLYQQKEDIVDDDGYETGEHTMTYAEAVEAQGSISPNSGSVYKRPFGNFLDYDKVIVLDDMSCPIDESTVLFVDKEPEYDEDGNPLYDYIVNRVTQTMNFIAVAISRVAR